MKRVLALTLSALLLIGMLHTVALAGDAQPKVLRFATETLKGAFNPILSSDVYDSYICSLIFAGLVSADEQAKPIFDENCVATSVDLSEDKLTYTFKIKEGLKFSNGDPLTASDVAFTFKMIAHPEYDGARASVVSEMVGYEAYHDKTSEDFEGIKLIDDYTISFTLKEPYVAEVTQLSGYGILCEEYYTKDTYAEFKDLNGKPIGSGPFVLDSFEPAQAANLSVNPNWSGKAPKIDGVSVLLIPGDTQIMALSSGQVDLIQASTANQDNYDAIIAGGAKVQQFMGRGYNAMMLNHQTPLLADKMVRKALMHGYDRASFIENEYEGFASICLAPVYPKLWAFPTDDSKLDRYAFDPELAKKMLEEAGWVDTNGDGIRDKDGLEMNLRMYIYPESAWPGHLAALLKEQWGAIGVGLETENLDFNSVMDAAYEGRNFEKFDMWTQGWSLATDPDPTAMFGEAATTTKGGFNPGAYRNEEALKLFVDGRAEYDEGKRAEIYWRWVEIANDELPMLFNAVRDELWGVAANVEGFEKMNPFYTWTSCILDIEIK